MLKSNYKKLFFTLALGVFLFSAKFTYALEIQYPDIFGMSVNSNSSLPEYAKYFFNLGIMLAGFLAVLVVMFGGLYYLISLNRGKFTDEGKEWIKAGLLGLTLTMCSYVIVYTINPDLVIFKLDKLLPAIFQNSPSNNDNNPNLVIYKEIPIGILIENTIARTMDCYNFDFNGDPIEAPITKDDGQKIMGPTLINHDRVDCLAKLSQAAKKKTRVIQELALKIAEIMEQCRCDDLDEDGNRKCESVCSQCDAPEECVPENQEGECIGDCTTIRTCKPPKKDCCPKGVKKIIEQGPIEIGGIFAPDSCSSIVKIYDGLNEFRSNTASVAALIEKKIQADGRTITIIDNGNCQNCDEVCPKCVGSGPSFNACLQKQQACQQAYQNCMVFRQNCIKNGAWEKLALIDQLSYFKEKMAQIVQKIKIDSLQMENASKDLSDCYLADPYVNYLKIKEETREKNIVVMAEKEYYDPETNSSINIAKYCKGFDYGNSSCFETCDNKCPGDLAENLGCYKKCACEEGDTICLQKQKKCTTDCYMKRSCTQSSGNFNTFGQCIVSCKKDCFNNCLKEFPNCEGDLEKCVKQCNDNSVCLLQNLGKCMLNSQKIADCAKKTDDPVNLQNCIDSSYYCQYGSEQNSGFPECLKSPYSLSNQYSADFIYKNPSFQLCPNPYAPSSNDTKKSCMEANPQTVKCPSSSDCPECPCGIIEKVSLYSSSGSSSSGAGGAEPCPPGECRGSDDICSPGNCPSGDDPGNGEDPGQDCACSTAEPGTPECYLPCNYEAEEPDDCLCPDAEPGTPECYSVCESGSSSGSEISSIDINREYRVVIGQCSQYSYNDDPLTFYCKEDWWDNDAEKDETPIGDKRVCSKAKEIPVGQAIDNTIIWANELEKKISPLLGAIEQTVSYIKKIGQEKGYCECGSTCDGGLPCHSDCFYYELFFETIDEYGETITVCEPQCAKFECYGIACQKMINLLRGGGSYKNCPVIEDGVPYYYKKMTKADENFQKYIVENSRSDILKQLTYSRTTTNNCSLVKSAFSGETKLLSCERALDDLLSPVIDGKIIANNEVIESYCYGKQLGEIFGIADAKELEFLSNNWFCCEEWKNPKAPQGE